MKTKVLNRANQFHRGRKKDRRASKRKVYGQSQAQIALDYTKQKQPWYVDFQVAELLKAHRR